MKKNLLIGIAVLGGILILGGAAFLGARLLNPALGANGPSGRIGSPGRMLQSKGGAGGGKSVELNKIPAAEVPEREPDISGVVTEIKDKSLMVTSVKGITVMRDKNGETAKNFEYDGSAVEVVVTQDTQIYNDTTFDELDMDKLDEGTHEFQQTVETLAFSELAPETMVAVWGYKRGDRLIAEVIVAQLVMGK